MHNVQYLWQGTVERVRYRSSGKKTVYVDTRFAKQGNAANAEAEALMERIIKDIKENSGLILPKEKEKQFYIILGVAILVIIIGLISFTVIGTAGVVLAMIGFFGIWGAIFFRMHSGPVGSTSSVGKVREYLGENKVKWVEELKKFGYDMSWELSERSVSFKGKRGGRRGTLLDYSPVADITFSYIGNGGQQIVMMAQPQQQMMMINPHQGQQMGVIQQQPLQPMMMNGQQQQGYVQPQQPMMMNGQQGQPMMMNSQHQMQGQPMMMNGQQGQGYIQQGQPMMMMNQQQGQHMMNYQNYNQAPPPPPS